MRIADTQTEGAILLRITRQYLNGDARNRCVLGRRWHLTMCNRTDAGHLFFLSPGSPLSAITEINVLPENKPPRKNP
jgi:hypothetical protein